MIERFGRICFWTGTAIAVLLVAVAFARKMEILDPRRHYLVSDATDLVFIGIGAFLLGWVVRYILAGSPKDEIH